jgi:hypothetical protein
MGFGAHLREVTRRRFGFALCLGLAILAAVWSVARISLAPPGLHSRALEIATASTSVVVDTPKSALLDLRQDTYDLESLKNRAVLLGTVVDSGAVRQFISSRAGIPADQLEVVTPRTANQPRATAKAGEEKHTTDILQPSGQYRIDVEADPTVPILNIYAQAPTKRVAERLADSVVTGVQAYLAGFAQTHGTVAASRVRLEQLGPARGGVINHGVRLQLAIVTFGIVFAGACAALLGLARIRAGWRLAAASERLATD